MSLTQESNLSKAVVRKRGEFLYERGETKEIAPKPGFRGCYLFKHELNRGAVPPQPRDTYTLVLYVDAEAGPIEYVMNDGGDALVVDVMPGCTLAEVRAAVVEHLPKGQPGGPGGAPGSVTTNP
ncbi:MAG TPA: hypothetical protein VFS43_25500 [Polyangiaceae bacterium]|nr:hypothetical protein [Polyangiaceae bacterium]